MSRNEGIEEEVSDEGSKTVYKLNESELLFGAAFGLSMVWWTHWWAIPVAILCALLWALGGAINKSYRRIGCAAVQAIALFAATKWPWILLAGLPAHLILRIGYGIPQRVPNFINMDNPCDFFNKEEFEDPGSVLGRFWYKASYGLFYNEQMRQDSATVLTRGILFIGLLLCYLIPLWRFR